MEKVREDARTMREHKNHVYFDLSSVRMNLPAVNCVVIKEFIKFSEQQNKCNYTSVISNRTFDKYSKRRTGSVELLLSHDSLLLLLLFYFID